ncbi:MAG: ABC transporter substrate-binding protein [Myxococcaceae bacterium]|nr:ABC transporter substrate-binding protein [Myxococcaceae bacterium]
MGSRRFLFTFGVLGGLCSGVLTGIVLTLAGDVHLPKITWPALLCSNVVGFTLGGYLTWFKWATARARRRAKILADLAQNDLTVNVARSIDGSNDIRRLILSLRRALAQVQRVTGNVHRTCKDVGEQARMLMEAARRQGAAVDRTLGAVSGMGESLQAAGRRVGQLETFAQETTAALAEMTERIEQVASALTTLNEFAHRTSEQVQQMSERLSAIASSGEALVRFAGEAESFVAAVEGGIESVRRRANETGDLAREVTATAERGQALVIDSVKAMYGIEETVRRAAEIVDSLGTRSNDIARIVDVIQEIADQTHLLALNAAIIAAQAGENGRAFGVVADEVRGLAERTARSTREIATLVAGVRNEVETAVALVKDAREQASGGVEHADRASLALNEIRAITRKTFAAVESTVAETARLEKQGKSVGEASRRVGRQVDEVTRAAAEQVSHGRELVRQTQEMARLAESASSKAEDQARTGRDLSDSVLRLTAAIDEIRSAHQVLTRGDVAISEEVATVREDARQVIRIGDNLSRSIDLLSQEADGLEAEVFRFKLPEPRRGGVLRVGIHQSEMFESTRGLDPLFTLDNQLVEISANLFSGLLRNHDGMLVPDLAERWEADPSARRYRFHLRRGVTFHDGSRFTAHDVKRHFERLLDPAVKSPNQWILKDVEGAPDFIDGRADGVAGIEVLDDTTLEIRLQEPKAFFLHLVTLPDTAIARQGPDGRSIGTGPFRPTRIDRGGIVLERNLAYFRPDVPLLDRLEFHLFNDRAEALQHLVENRVDLVSGLYAEHLAAAALDDYQVLGGSTPSCWFLAFNVREPPFNDVRVRKAIRAGLDRAAVVEHFHPGARVAVSLTPPELLDDPDRPQAPTVDLALARRLLQEAGLSRLRMTVYYPSGRNTEAEDAVLFRPLVEEGLLEVQHVELRSADYWERAREGRIPVFRSGWIADYPDPDNFLYFLLNSNAQSVYALQYSSAELDQLTAEARVSIDPELRQQLYRRAERVVMQDCPLIPLYHERIWAVATPLVQGLRLHQTPPQVRFENLWVDTTEH